MSREITTHKEGGEQNRELASTQARAGGSESSGAIALGRITATETFWTHLQALEVAHDRAGIDALLLATYRSGALDSLIRGATSAQMSILYQTFQVMGAGGHASGVDVALWEIFCALPDSTPGMKRLCFQVRFRIDVIAEDRTPRQEVEWDAVSLKRLWLALSVLPNAHVENNPQLQHFIQYKQGTPNPEAGGYFDGNLAAVNFEVDAISTATQQSTSQVAAGDPLEKVNRFDKVMRHEVGHAVDAKLNLSNRYCRHADGGAWRSVTDVVGWVSEIFEQANTRAASYDAAGVNPTAVAHALATQKDKATVASLKQAIAPKSTDHHNDQALELVVKAYNDWGGQTDKPESEAGSRAFHRIDGWYYSYDADARTRQVSNYQFHTPMEWIAEAYAAYYEPDARGRGAKLAERDPTTKRWFDDNVHNK